MGLSPERTRLARWRDRDLGRSSRGWRRYARAVPRAGSSTPTAPRSRVRTNDARRRPRRRLLNGRRRLRRLSQPRLSRPTAKRRRGAGRRTSEAPRPRARLRAEVPSLRWLPPLWTPSPAPVPARRRLSRSSRRLPSRKPPAWTPPPVLLRRYPPRSPHQNSETRRSRRIGSLTRRRQRWRRRRRPRARASPRLPSPPPGRRRQTEQNRRSSLFPRPEPPRRRRAAMARCLPRRPSRRRRHPPTRSSSRRKRRPTRPR
mmetsp:Transcript_2361/g.9582  ORF Transcript_2361/g.9582 Transcript_2361/m.9582 type:complete len:258 (-) Transcript_2361:2306-3079(-)